MRRLLLISNSTQHGGGYLDHAEAEIRDFLGSSGSPSESPSVTSSELMVERVLFVPYALFDRNGYAATARGRFSRMGFGLDSVHQLLDPVKAVREAQALFIGGGNTFRLLDHLQREGLLGPIRERVAEGMPYMGSSAGSNVACPTICTTNDMPIVQPASFEALALVPFQLNPHYLDPKPGSTHQGETREERLKQYLEEQDRTVVALREGSMLRIEGDEMELRGTTDARIFRRGAEPREVQPGARLDELLR